MYLIAEATPLELPLAVFDTLSQTARACNTTPPAVCRVIRLGYVTTIFQGVPARIYKIDDKEAPDALNI